MCGLKRLVWLAVTCVALVPAAAHAQGAAIAGVVKDTSGAVLPGVSVEAASPVLIEKIRTAVTDGSGQYKIISLLPGTYTVTFTLQGFSTVKREGVEVTGTTTAAINADLKVGTLSETITVTGETPLVDVQSASVQKVVTKEVIDNIPDRTPRHQPGGAAARDDSRRDERHGRAQHQREFAGASQDVGGTAGDTFTDLSIHGGKASEQRQTIAGLSAATVIRFGESLSSSPSFTAMQEMSVDSSGADASPGRRRRPDELRPARRRQHVQGHPVLQRRQRLDAVDQLHDDCRRSGHQPPGARPQDAAGCARQGLRLQPGLRRSDRQGQAVVVRERALDAGRRTTSRRTIPT